MNNKINRTVGCSESCKEFLDDQTLILVNSPAHEKSSEFTDLKVNDQKFSEISNDPNSALKINSREKVLVNLSDKEGRKFPGVRVSELQIVDSLLNLKVESGDLISLLRLSDDEELPSEFVERVIDSCDLKEPVWTKF